MRGANHAARESLGVLYTTNTLPRCLLFFFLRQILENPALTQPDDAANDRLDLDSEAPVGDEAGCSC